MILIKKKKIKKTILKKNPIKLHGLSYELRYLPSIIFLKIKYGKWILYNKNLEFSISGFIRNLKILTAQISLTFSADHLALPGAAILAKCHFLYTIQILG